MTNAPTVLHGDAIEKMREMSDSSVDAIVTDPPYGLGFMGKAWDDLPPGLPWAQECLRVLKPGGHLLAFGGTRTWHRLAVAVEDAGFEVRDSIAWLYGSGFPKSLDVSKAIDKAAGATREVIGINPRAAQQTPKADVTSLGAFAGTSPDLTTPATPAAQQWQGWGTALKPAFEPIVVARKPLIGTVAANVLAHGTGALNIDGCRVGTPDGKPACTYPNGPGGNTFTVGGDPDGTRTAAAGGHAAGRWPANVLLDGSQADALDEQGPRTKDGTAVNRNRTPDNDRANYSAYQFGNARGGDVTYGGEGGPSRFFPTFRYQAKASTRERPKVYGVAHPTVKPVDLMRWLVRLVTPPGGVVLDPFAGSGTTGEAAMREGFASILIERESDYLPLIDRRIKMAAYEMGRPE